MESTTPIPLPSDDYDRPHTTTALLASLRCTTSSFDAVMDSLHSSVSHRVQRVVLLEKRVARAHALISKLETMYENNDKGLIGVCRIEYPSDYKEALKGIEHDLNKVKTSQLSALNAAKSAADSAIRSALKRDATMDDGEAIPSDAWLDQASMGIGGLAHSLEVAEAQRRVPLLYGSLIGEHAMEGRGNRCMDEMEYRGILDSMAKSNAETKVRIPESLADLAHSHTDGDDESVHSASSKMSALSMSSSSGRMTAIQRRKWHEQQQQLRNIKAGGVVVPEGEEEGGISANNAANRSKPTFKPATNSSSYMAGRQQAISGSHPYLCEVLHDSYGIGSDPPKGLVDCSGFSSRRTREAGTEFYPPPSSVGDLNVFNTSRDSYGLANRRAAAASAAMNEENKV
ncbi:hypothetical protein ACHAXN_011044 [Cyclotella atomus]